MKFLKYETRQRERLSRKSAVYDFFRQYWNEHKQAPTYRECGEALSISVVGVYYHVSDLVGDGLLIFDMSKRHRAIRVVAYDLQNQQLEELLSA